jgi:hypothetical protein
MKHLADHRSSSTGARLSHFLRLARNRSETTWARVWQKPRHLDAGGRRVVEYLRIERGREV